MYLHENYEFIRNALFSLSDRAVNINELEELKIKYTCDIQSQRKLDRIENLASLIYILENCDVLNLYNIEPFHWIVKIYIKDENLIQKLNAYNELLHNVDKPIFFDVYNNDYESSDQIELPLQDNRDIRNSNISQSPETTNSRLQVSSSERLQKVLEQISNQLGRSWRDVARLLGIRECEIDAIHEKYPTNLKLQSYHALKSCLEHYKSDKWIYHLMTALECGRRRDLKELVAELCYIDK